LVDGDSRRGEVRASGVGAMDRRIVTTVIRELAKSML